MSAGIIKEGEYIKAAEKTFSDWEPYCAWKRVSRCNVAQSYVIDFPDVPVPGTYLIATSVTGDSHTGQTPHETYNYSSGGGGYVKNIGWSAGQWAPTMVHWEPETPGQTHRTIRLTIKIGADSTKNSYLAAQMTLVRIG